MYTQQTYGNKLAYAQASLEQACHTLMNELSLDRQSSIALLSNAIQSNIEACGLTSTAPVNTLPLLTEQESHFISGLFQKPC
ncbi:hypothetical protein [Thalassotalea fusca]